MNWAAFAAAAPDIARFAVEGFREQNLCLVGTLRADARLLTWSLERSSEQLRHPDDAGSEPSAP